MNRRLALFGEQRRQPRRQLLPRRFARVALADLGLAEQHVAQNAVWIERAARVRAAEKQPARVEIERLLEFRQQAALAEACLADDGEGARSPLRAGRGEGGADDRQLGFAADHLGVHALDAATGDAKGARLGAFHEIAAQGLLDPLDLDEDGFADLEQAAHVAMGVVADAEPTRWRALLHARRDVHRCAANAAFGIDAAAEQHRAGVQARPHHEVGDAVPAPHLRGLLLRVFDDRQPGSNGAFDIVLRWPSRCRTRRACRHRCTAARARSGLARWS